jgi:hypothetical protein
MFDVTLKFLSGIIACADHQEAQSGILSDGKSQNI